MSKASSNLKTLFRAGTKEDLKTWAWEWFKIAVTAQDATDVQRHYMVICYEGFIALMDAYYPN